MANAFTPADQSYFLVMQEFGKQLGCEAIVHPDDTCESVIQNIIDGQYGRIVWITELNPVEGWSKDVSEDIAQTIFSRHSHEPFANHVADFLEKHLPDFIAVQLRRAA